VSREIALPSRVSANLLAPFSVSHAHTWKIIKPHAIALIQDVIFPLMSFSEADEELWEMDAVEYIRQKFDVFDDVSSPVPAAESLLHSLCKTRKGILNNVMNAFLTIINNPSITPKEKDGALHMVGSLADVLPKKKVFKDQVENLLVTYVFPGFQSTQGHLRARSCWVLHSFSDIKIKNPANLAKIMELTSNALLTDPDLPVKVEAAVALQMYLISQPESTQFIEHQIKPITVELLKIIRETENEDLTNALQKIVCSFSDQLVPIAIDICQHLATTFSQVLEGDDANDDRAITAMGLLNTMETLLSVMEEKPDVIASLHPIVLQVIGHILQNNISEFYEEAFSLIYDLTSKKISPDMWKLLELIYQMFEKDGLDYYLDMMPTLYNYVTIDTEAFLSNPNHVLALFNMSKKVLTNTDVTEESECNAAKLLEVIILQCRGQVNECIPSFVELVLGRLIREVKTSELRTMCLQVVIAALYTNPVPLLDILSKQQMPNSTDSILSHFVKQWIHDTDCFLGVHDRKLWIIGMCTLITLGNSKPTVLSEVSNEIIPSLIMIFDGLKRAYEARAEAEEEEEETDDEDFDDCEEGISSDEDEMVECNDSYMNRIGELAQKKGSEQGLEIVATVKDGDSEDEDSEDDDSDEGEETALEGFTTPLDEEESPQYVDEYLVFSDVMRGKTKALATWHD
jgi:importin-7